MGALARLAALSACAALASGIANAAGKTVKRDVDIVEASVAALQEAMAAGRLTSRALTARYLARIKAIDKAGPKLNSVIEVNPDALAIAGQLDRERKAKGPRGPLHGIPVLLKDNIATADRMQTTAGSLALVEAKPPRDAYIVARLREAGAVIIGKTNLSEWANIRSTRSTSGWSSRGGLSRNPYALDRNSSGSSSGSAVAVRDVVVRIAKATGREDLLRVGSIAAREFEVPEIYAGLSVLRSIGFEPAYTIEEGIARTVDWWRGKGGRCGSNDK